MVNGGKQQYSNTIFQMFCAHKWLGSAWCLAAACFQLSCRVHENTSRPLFLYAIILIHFSKYCHNYLFIKYTRITYVNYHNKTISLTFFTKLNHSAEKKKYHYSFIIKWMIVLTTIIYYHLYLDNFLNSTKISFNQRF